MCINAKFLSKERPHSRGTVGGIAAYRHLGGDGITRQTYTDNCQRHCKVVADIPDILLSIQQLCQVGDTIVANELLNLSVKIDLRFLLYMKYIMVGSCVQARTRTTNVVLARRHILMRCVVIRRYFNVAYWMSCWETIGGS